MVFQRLAGTFNVYVYGISPAVPQSLMSSVQSALDLNCAYPLQGTALLPALVGISVAATVTLAAGTSAASVAMRLSASWLGKLGSPLAALPVPRPKPLPPSAPFAWPAAPPDAVRRLTRACPGRECRDGGEIDIKKR